MEGVTDWVMRDTITEIGGLDLCVTEFLRVTDKLHPELLFYRNCPELKTGGKTRFGIPVFLQLLGGQAQPLAENAQRAAKLGALGIDLNFGCPAKTVNRHDGGAVLLKSCDRLYDIASTVRKAVPAHIPVTAKIRLGFDDPSQSLDNVKALNEAGVKWITVHCRTKVDGYKPPAYWEWMPRLSEVSQVPLIANGEIWNVADYKRCKEVSGAQSFMIGRGMMSNPFIFQQIKDFEQTQNSEQTLNWQRTKKLLVPFYEASTLYVNEYFAVSRTKQWLKMLSLKDAEIKPIFDEIKIITKPPHFKSTLERMTLD
ncbi:MAG: tRNA dihydrouridine synthase [Bdellovibrionia bacterium]